MAASTISSPFLLSSSSSATSTTTPKSSTCSRTPPSRAPRPLRSRLHGGGRHGSGLGSLSRSFRVGAGTMQEKEQKVAVEDSFSIKTTLPTDAEGVLDSDSETGTTESWAVKIEQSVNIFLTESVVMILDGFYRDRDYARFFVLETIARVPYFAFISVLHMYESFGWWRRADYIKVHFAESWNELHHLLIMEELGGNSVWVDRLFAQFAAFFYYFMTVAMYMLSPRMAYHFSECVERHAYSTYDKFIKLNGEKLKKLPAPEVAISYYMNEDLYLFDEFQTAGVPCSRRPKIENLYDVFVNIRDDEAEHCKTMKACQTPGTLRSPHSLRNCSETDSECIIPETDCQGIVDCVKKSLNK